MGSTTPPADLSQHGEPREEPSNYSLPSDPRAAADTISGRFLRGAGHVRETDNPILKYFPPARWAVIMVQYLIAVTVLAIVEGFKAILTKSKQTKRHVR